MEYTPTKTEINYTILQNEQIKFPANFNENAIFHYTSIGGLDGIMRHKTLRFTNIMYMNDKDEITAGIKSLEKALTASGITKKLPIPENIFNDVQVFVCCFSLDGDSLPMWNYYTKDINSQGYNIEFNSKQLVESILKDNELLDGCNISFGIVDYSTFDDSKYSTAVVNGISSSADVFWGKLLRYIMNCGAKKQYAPAEQKLRDDLDARITQAESENKLNKFPVYSFNGEACKFEDNSILDYLSFVKRDCFKQEKEFRIIITVPNENLPKLKGDNKPGIYKFRISNGIMVPYLELNFSPETIHGLTISPTVHSDLVERSLKDFLYYCDFDAKKLSPKHSNVPVRF